MFYQLTARRFQYDRNLLGEEPDNTELRELIAAFSNAYRRSSSLEGLEVDYSIHSFADRSNFPNLYQYTLESEAPVTHENLEPHPAHYSARTFQLNAKKYLELIKSINKLIVECEDEPNSSDGLCTVALLAFDGATREGGTVSAVLNSFV